MKKVWKHDTTEKKCFELIDNEFRPHSLSPGINNKSYNTIVKSEKKQPEIT